jgi:hypothetical protein
VKVSGYVPAVPEAGVPLSVPVPFPLSLNVTPLGSAPVSLSEGVGLPVAVTVKLPAVPTVKVVLLALVIAGDVPPLPTVSVKLWLAAVPTPLLAVKVSGYVPAVPEAGVPLSVPVPFPLFLNVTPLGSAPVSLSEGVGLPVAVTAKLPAVPTVNVVLFALVIAGAWFTWFDVIASSPRITSSVAVPVPNVALCAPAATPTLCSIIWPVIPQKLFPKLPLPASYVLLSLSPVYPLPAVQVVSTPRQSTKTKSLEFEVVSPLIVATPPEAGVVLYWGVPSNAETVPL